MIKIYTEQPKSRVDLNQDETFFDATDRLKAAGFLTRFARLLQVVQES